MRNLICDTDTGMEILYRGKTLKNFVFDSETANLYNQSAYDLDLEPLSTEADWSTDFFIPEHYKNIHVEDYFNDLVKDHDQTIQNRVQQELELYKAKNLYPVLQLMIYIIDELRENNVVWGVGRGSSVASYCLYLLGIHRVNSIEHDLDIHEFLR